MSAEKPEDKPRVRGASYLTPHVLRRLDLACLPVLRAWPNFGPYLVGSVLERPDYRDVDVRVILADDEWDRIFGPGRAEDDGGAHGDPHWTFVCAAVSLWLSETSGLPVDFQIQRMTEANARYSGRIRNPLGVRLWTYPEEPEVRIEND